MCDSKEYYIALFRVTPARAAWVFLVCLGALILSCDEVERHNALTFFFDGVPPLSGAELEGGLFDPSSPELEQAGQKPAWYVHEPRKDCSNCHRKQRPGGFSAQTYLIAPVPQLCLKCHTDPAASASFVHGPVAVGQCLFCHNPHTSKVKHLLREAESKLCYLCHDTSMIELIPAHLTQQTSACTDCHYPHAGPTKALLKESPSQTEYESGSGKTTGTAAQEDIGLVKVKDVEKLSTPPETEDKTVEERRHLFEVFWQVSRLIEQGELQKAREYLEAITDSELLTEDERGKIENVLSLIDEALANGAGQPQNGPGATAPEAADKSDGSAAKRIEEVADLYYRSMAYYRDGQLVRAREGFVKVLSSGLIPTAMENTIRGYIADIDRTLARGNQGR
ncbi:MAG: hypothetical protein JSW66_19490 [Phycisphaerales bacterium]|nr:MAG: hypothetical protein JSW66_19490 [Phycisphaerales bacterium]